MINADTSESESSIPVLQVGSVTVSNSNSCTASFTQVVGIAALRGNQSSVEKMCGEFKCSDAFVAA